jgi:hypothetical protein
MAIPSEGPWPEIRFATYEGRAADSLALAGAAASKEDDHRALELLTSEFTNIKSWADHFIDARNSLSAAELSISEDPLKDDAQAQKALSCGQFLAQMLARGTFQDDATCH